MKGLRLLFIAISLVFFVGCDNLQDYSDQNNDNTDQNTENESDQVYITSDMDMNSLVYDMYGGTKTVHIEGKTAWTAKAHKPGSEDLLDWITISPNSSDGSQSVVEVQIIVDANDVEYVRSADLVFKAANNTIDMDLYQEAYVEPIYKAVNIPELNIGQRIKAKGKTVASNKRGFILSDDDGSKYNVYVDCGENTGVEIPRGAYYVIVEGNVQNNGCYNFLENVTVSKESGFFYMTPNPTVYEGAAIEAVKDLISPKHIQYDGILSISGENYYLTIEGTSLQGCILYPNDDIAQFLNENNGKKIRVRGYTLGVSDDQNYINTMAASTILAD